ncbi:Neuroblast differentiation-associated protein [Cordyceps fumosorosea ARSEF 2679]|uniref:Neuroblast differentiation-associated protein n=1 Tax=Cordyceps fumosorosea (strain ARSEF 2679) TaxID=1081104 RepID=A0A167XIN0_CORFA|nr:Neuroblast differentiation-associated protein [Cordyceps fumosorosea ARSEF 2679]OAA65017.1 Neuroblast differentiation-associated protein [Cordyceps fumosorosea ARSEF 2679]
MVNEVYYDELGQRARQVIRDRFLPRCNEEEKQKVETFLLSKVKFAPSTVVPRNHCLVRSILPDACPELLRRALSCFVFGLKLIKESTAVSDKIKPDEVSLNRFQLVSDPCITLPKFIHAPRAVKRKALEAQAGAPDGNDNGDEKRARKKRCAAQPRDANCKASPTSEASGSSRETTLASEVDQGLRDPALRGGETRHSSIEIDDLNRLRVALKQSVDITQGVECLPEIVVALENKVEGGLGHRNDSSKDVQDKLEDFTKIPEDREKALENGKCQLDDLEKTPQDGNGRVDDRRSELEDRERRLQDRERRLQDRERRLQDREAQLHNLEKTVKSCEAELKTYEKALEISEATLSRRENELDCRKEELQSIETVLNAKQEELNTRSKMLKSSEAALEGQEAALLCREKELECHRKNLESTETDLKTRGGELNTLIETLNTSEEDLKCRGAALLRCEINLGQREQAAQAGEAHLKSKHKKENDEEDYTGTLTQAGRCLHDKYIREYQEYYDRSILDINQLRMLIHVTAAGHAQDAERGDATRLLERLTLAINHSAVMFRGMAQIPDSEKGAH